MTLEEKITDNILDKLGFSEYWDEHCNWGGRTLTFSDGTRFRIIDHEKEDDDGNSLGDNYFYFTGRFAIPKIDAAHFDLDYLYQMKDCISQCYPHCLTEFENKIQNLKS